MTEQRIKVSEKELEEFGERFSRRYIFKKKANAILCFFIALCGTTAVLYSRFIFHNALFDRLRYMTFWGTIFTSAVSLVFMYSRPPLMVTFPKPPKRLRSRQNGPTF